MLTDIRQSNEYADYMRMLGWLVDEVDSVFCYTKKILFLGSITKIQRQANLISLKGFEKLRKKRKSFVIYIEPLDTRQEDYYLNELKFKKTKISSLPTKTVRIDLSNREKKLLQNMHYKTRYNVKIARKRGVEIEMLDDIERFANFWQDAAEERGMFLSLKGYIKSIYKAFGKEAKIFFALKDGQVLGGVLTVSTKSVSYYMYAASSREGKKLSAPSLLAWEAIKNAKKVGKEFFDFEGVYDERYPIKSWKGFSRFKKSFGGYEVGFPATLRRYFFPFGF